MPRLFHPDAATADSAIPSSHRRRTANGIERTRSTRIEVDTLTPRRLEASRRKALAVLNEETEVLRLKDREVRIRDSPLIIG